MTTALQHPIEAAMLDALALHLLGFGHLANPIALMAAMRPYRLSTYLRDRDLDRGRRIGMAGVGFRMSPATTAGTLLGAMFGRALGAYIDNRNDTKKNRKIH